MHIMHNSNGIAITGELNADAVRFISHQESVTRETVQDREIITVEHFIRKFVYDNSRPHLDPLRVYC